MTDPDWTASEPLTRESLQAAFDAIRNQPPQKPCTHLVSPRALDRPGIYLCHWCGVPVEIPYPLREHA